MPAEVRVLLTAFNQSASLTIRGESLEYASAAGGFISLKATEINVSSSGTMPILTNAARTLSIRSTKGVLEVSQGATRRQYRGTVVVYPGTQSPVNIIPIEDYLRSVTPSEMPPRFPLEALKAQAVAARSYTAANFNRHRLQNANLCDSHHCQGYRGSSSESPRTDEAVSQTRGQLLMVGNRPLNAQYSTDCGGYTAENSQLGPNSSRPDSADDGRVFCELNPSHKWSIRVSQNNLLTSLGEVRNTPVRRIRITERDRSGRIRSLLIFHNHGQISLDGNRLRTALTASGMKSLRARMKADQKNGDILIEGTGHGHGVGMCQWGSRTMAMEPYNRDYRQILEHYYPGAVILTTAQTILLESK